MNDRLRDALDSVHASEALKARTKAYVAAHSGGLGRQMPRRRGLGRGLAAAACLTLALLFGGGWFFLMPTAFISIDINPSLELGVNRFDQVVSVEGYNEAGQALADTLELRFLSYDDAVEQILDNEAVADMLLRDGALTVAVAGPDTGQCARMLSRIESSAADHGEAHCYLASEAEAHEAREAGMSCGRYRAYLALLERYPNINPDEVEAMSMGEIRDLLDKETTDPSVVAPDSCGGGDCGHRHRH